MKEQIEKNAIYLNPTHNQLIEKDFFIDEDSINIGEGPFTGTLTNLKKDTGGVLIQFKGDGYSEGIEFTFYMKFGEYYKLSMHENFHKGICKTSIKGIRKGKTRTIKILN